MVTHSGNRSLCFLIALTALVIAQAYTEPAVNFLMKRGNDLTWSLGKRKEERLKTCHLVGGITVHNQQHTSTKNISSEKDEFDYCNHCCCYFDHCSDSSSSISASDCGGDHYHYYHHHQLPLPPPPLLLLLLLLLLPPPP